MSINAEVRHLSASTVSGIVPACAGTLFWELAPASDDAQAPRRITGSLDTALEKESWLTSVLVSGCGGGFSVHLPGEDNPPVGTLLFAHPTVIPGASKLPTAPVSADAYVITSIHMEQPYRGDGLELLMIDATLITLDARGVPAVEVFAIRRVPSPDELLNPAHVQIWEDAKRIGLYSHELWESAGFQLVEDHPLLPRYRMEMPPPLSVQELLGEALLSPEGTTTQGM